MNSGSHNSRQHNHKEVVIQTNTINSGSGLERRILKLWISLWELVLGNKRHLETVCSVLQQLVFDLTEWPRFKNWRAIAEIGKTDNLMMLALATLNMSRMDERLQQIMVAFPDCFTSQEIEILKPVPLSVIRTMAIAAKNREMAFHDTPAEKGANFPVSFGVLQELGFPILEFKTHVRDTVDRSLPLVPTHIRVDFPQGTIVNWEKRQFVVVENNRKPGVNLMYLVPLECIDPNT